MEPEYSTASISHRIRHGQDPENPTLFNRWFLQEQVLCERLPVENRRQCYESQYRLLLETVMDELVPAHWRYQCLDHIHKPLAALQALVNGDHSARHLRQLQWELLVSSHYVRHSFN